MRPHFPIGQGSGLRSQKFSCPSRAAPTSRTYRIPWIGYDVKHRIKQRVSTPKPKQHRIYRGSPSHANATGDRIDPLKFAGEAANFIALNRGLPELAKFTVSKKTVLQIVKVLGNDLSYVQKLQADIRAATFGVMHKELARERKILRKSHLQVLHHPPSTPASLKERMTREPLESAVDRFQILSKTQKEIALALRETQTIRATFCKGGVVVRRARAKLMVLLQDASVSRRKAGVITTAIMKAWNSSIAPKNAETARISSLRQRQK